MLDRIASVTVSNDALYLAGARMPIAIDPPPDFVLARIPGGAVTVTVPSTAPPGAYDLAAEIPGPPAGTAILMRAAINVAPPHFGKPARAQ
jgi:hypothetical protein